MIQHFLLRLAIFLCVLGTVGEVFFRSVIPARQSPIARQEPTLKLMNFDPQAEPSGHFTSGRLAQQRSRWRINELGWNSEYDYTPEEAAGRPIVAITGDSQIEGFYVEHSEHIIRQTESNSGGRIIGYSFGIAGYKLAEYIQVARYLAHHKMQPSVFVMYINRGDVWRSVLDLGGVAGTAAPRLKLDGDAVRLVPGAVYQPPGVRRLFRGSALARYFVFNARLNPFKSAAADLGMTKKSSYPEANAKENPIYGRAIRFAISEIQKALPGVRIVFLVDADRRAIEAGKKPFPLGTSPVIKANCPKPWCTHLDLTKTFETAWKNDRRTFSFPGNYHWNRYAHALAGAALHRRLNTLKWLP